MKDIYQVIKKVRISEKATMLQETTGELVLEVDRDANKIEIKKAVEVAFGKKVGSVTARFYGDDFEAGKKSGGITVIEGRSDKANLQLLSAGGLDAVLAPEDSARGIITAKRLDNIDKSHAYLISNVGHLAFVKTAKQTDLLDRFNKTIAAMKQDGTLAKIVKEELSRSNF